MWDDFLTYARRNQSLRKSVNSVSPSELSVSLSPTDENENSVAKKSEMEFHYIEVDSSGTERRLLPKVLTPDSAEKEIEVASSLPVFDNDEPE